MIRTYIICLIPLIVHGQEQELTPIEEIKCITDNKKPGLCVNYFLCNETTGLIKTDGSSLLSPRYGDDETLISRSDEAQCPKSLNVCCEDPIAEPLPDRTTQKPPVNSMSCGRRNDKGISVRIASPKLETTQFGEFPWMVAILRDQLLDTTTVKVYRCGGALIHPKVVVTAAHCIKNGTENLQGLSIRAGEWDSQTTLEPIPHQDKRVKTILGHEYYTHNNLFHDIALLILEEPLSLTGSIDLICAPNEEKVYADKEKCFVTGWGKNEYGRNGTYQVTLKKLELPIVEKTQCQASLRTTRLGPRFLLHNSFICAGGELGKDVCTGDGGSPLVCPVEGKPGHYELAGIVSWGIGCGEDGIPGAYANVPYFISWIKEQLLFHDIFDFEEVNKS